ncbi:hypothetical protein C8J55DRAFT_489746 [Lentinula edodes]|uniref:Uncharacterized protein n=1 Tax=Lentinula lateritia TaxID=40482 RepID=A0A9W9A9N7_9AGAR|nr:hypothetical protein C8J55DRAFT_489746 [Lentinula edodes]
MPSSRILSASVHPIIATVRWLTVKRPNPVVDSGSRTSVSSGPASSISPISSESPPPVPGFSNLINFDLLPSTPPPSISPLAGISFDPQDLHGNSVNARLDAVARFICDIEYADTDREGRLGWEKHPTSHDLIAETESPVTSKAESDLRTVARDVAMFALDGSDESSEKVFVCCETMDKNINKEYYMQCQEGHPTPQSPSPGCWDDVLSCWKTGPQFSFHAFNLQAVNSAWCEGGSSMIPLREHDPIVHQCVLWTNAPWIIGEIPSEILAPKPINSTQVRMKEVEDLEKVAYKLVEDMEIIVGSTLFAL